MTLSMAGKPGEPPIPPELPLSPEPELPPASPEEVPPEDPLEPGDWRRVD